MIKAIIIDGNSLIYKSYFVHKIDKNISDIDLQKKTTQTYQSLLMKIIQQNSAIEYAVIVFDSGKKSFRHEKYPNYKIQRPIMENNLIACIPKLQEITRNLKIFQIIAPAGYEADDVIATISKYFSYSEIKTNIYTTDKDLLQLVNHLVSVTLLKKGLTDVIINNHNTFKKLNNDLLPYQMPLFKALTGDDSDNYPGIKGIGEKTATKLLNEYKNIKNIYNNLGQLKPKIADVLKNEEKSLYFYLSLSTLISDIHLDYWINNFKFNISSIN